MDLINLNNDRRQQRKKPGIDLSTMVYGKVPPQATELEGAILGACMLEKSAFDRVSEILKPGCLYRSENAQIFQAMVNLNHKGQAIDILTVVEELKRMEVLELVGGPYYVERLTNSVVSAANIVTHSQIVKQKFMQREMIRISGETISAAYEDSADVFEIIETHEKAFTELTTGNAVKSFTAQDEALVESIKRIEALRLKDDHMTGVPCGLTAIDQLTHGWQNSDLIIMAARPAVGKTALALQFARYAALNPFKPVPVGFWSLEMSTTQLTDRNLSAESEIYLENIRNGKLDDAQMKILYAKAVQKLASAKIFYDDSAGLTIHELKARVRRLKRQWVRDYKTEDGLIIIDYLQLMSGTGKGKGNREQEISEISRGLKQIAKEINNPIIALSQLSRAPEQRTGDKKMPQLSDLRESGAIEQDADMVMFIYRPEYYGENSNEMGESNKGETHVRIAKHRNGSLDTVKLRADLSIQKFYTWDGFDAPSPKSNFQPLRMPYADRDDPI
jgi:replicative DNA helicase